jgi:sugar/nucleoside kinase (ribokinase family)
MQNEAAFAGTSLCVVGNINRDVKTTPLPAGDYLFRDGETSVSSITETIGGGGANSAFAAAALGARVAFLGKVGADGLGDRLQRTLTQHGIAAHLAKDAQHPSGTSIALNFDKGHRHFVSCLPANESLTLGDLNLEALRGHRHLLRADVWFSEAMLFEGNKLMFEAAHHAGLNVSLDLNWDPQWGRAGASQIQQRKEAVRGVLPLVNLAHGNERELMEFADAADLETALKKIVGWGAGAIVVHLGSRGAGYYTHDEWLVEPSTPVAARVNSTGTGDVLSVCMMLLDQRREISLQQRLCAANQSVGRFMEGKLNLIPVLAD